jgi:pyruvate/2-oxoglutarate dehydrogenase complex dihydrolipoamide acyltransferase (E2) component
MVFQLNVPAVIEDVTEIRVLEWHGSVGQSIAVGDLIVELETHKALIEVRAGQPGILRQILAAEGSWCRVGAPLGVFSDDALEHLPETEGEAAEMLAEFLVA